MIGHKIVDGIELPLTPEDIAENEALNLAWEQGAGGRVREDRDQRLLEVDAFVGNPLRWATLSAEQQEAWAVYRQGLLDVPQQAGFPNTVVWPVSPS